MRKSYDKKNFLFYFLVFSVYFNPFAFADNVGDIIFPGKPLDAREIAKTVNRIKDIQKGIDSISAAIYQKKKNPLLKKEILTEGTIVLKKPNLLFWDVTKPERISIIVDGKIMWVYHPDLKEAQKYVLSEQFMARQTMEFFLSALTMSFEETGKRFDIAAYNSDDSFVFAMKPKSGMVRKYLSDVYIWYKHNEGIPYKFEVIGKNENTTVTELKDIKLNPPVNENIFRFDAPEGVVITNIENEGRGY